ncbi:hypothetical protein [Desertivirga xinjiangensis]|uniref:hypothetical protein n=1 Tax=Desertivirga xinjiangensis TaxID=539206 RepID=UPI00210EDF2C|nr:hypothetical protein [Pedobacter xinjiangensis]
MYREGKYVLYAGYLREVVGEFNNNLIIENGYQYILIPGNLYPILNLPDLIRND